MVEQLKAISQQPTLEGQTLQTARVLEGSVRNTGSMPAASSSPSTTSPTSCQWPRPRRQRHGVHAVRQRGGRGCWAVEDGFLGA